MGLGRPSSIPESEISIPEPTEQPFLLALVQLSRIMCKSAQNIYGQRHESLLPMWKAAKEIRRALKVFSQRLCDVMNFWLESSPQAGELGVCQTVLLLRRLDCVVSLTFTADVFKSIITFFCSRSARFWYSGLDGGEKDRLLPRMVSKRRRRGWMRRASIV